MEQPPTKLDNVNNLETKKQEIEKLKAEGEALLRESQAAGSRLDSDLAATKATIEVVNKIGARLSAWNDSFLRLLGLDESSTEHTKTDHTG